MVARIAITKELSRMKDMKKVPHGWARNHGQYKKNNWVKYKIKHEDWERFWEEQGGKCAGCRREFAHPLELWLGEGYRPEVDHCHKTEIVRGLLCRECNDFLGKIQDNQTTMENLVAYLRRNGGWNGADA